MSVSTPPPFNPDGFFSFASLICRDSNADEAALRSAISRAYYSAFLAARDSLFGTDAVGLTKAVKKRIVKNFQIRKKEKRGGLGLHETVISAILEKTNNITLSHQLEQLREARVSADYRRSHRCLLDVGKRSWREYAEETMQLAALILPSMKRLPSY